MPKIYIKYREMQIIFYFQVTIDSSIFKGKDLSHFAAVPDISRFFKNFQEFIRFDIHFIILYNVIRFSVSTRIYRVTSISCT